MFNLLISLLSVYLPDLIERLLCEGLAFLYMSYVPHVTSPSTDLTACLGTGQQDILDVLRDVRKDGRLMDFVEQNPIVFNDDVGLFFHAHFIMDLVN